MKEKKENVNLGKIPERLWDEIPVDIKNKIDNDINKSIEPGKNSKIPNFRKDGMA